MNAVDGRKRQRRGWTARVHMPCFRFSKRRARSIGGARRGNSVLPVDRVIPMAA